MIPFSTTIPRCTNCRRISGPIPLAVEILILLAEHSGRVVTKEQISDRVWRNVFIDESNIAKNVSLLRKALKEHLSDVDPIQTIPKRGYRLTVPVFIVDSSALSAANPSSFQGIPPKNHLLLLTTALVLLVLCIIVVMVARKRHQKPQGRQSVAVLPFANLGSDPNTAWFSAALQETLVSDLGIGERLRLIPDDDTERMQRDLKLSLGGNLSQQQLKRIRSNFDCDFVVEGAYLKVGDSLRVDIYLQETKTGKTVLHFTQTRPPSQLLGLISQTGTDLRKALGIGPPTDNQTYATALAASVPVDPTALQLYAEGLQQLRLFDGPQALPLLQHSIDIDPSYPLVHAALADTYSLMGDDKSAAAEAKRAYETSSKLAREERLVIEAHYERATHQWDKAVATQRSLVALFPDNTNYSIELAQILLLAGRPADALKTVTGLEQGLSQADPVIYLTEASIEYQTKDFQRMLLSSRQAEKLAQEREAQILVGRANTLEGDALVHVGDVAQARAEFEKSQAIASMFGDKVGLMHALRRYGGAVRDDDPRASIPVFNKDCEIADQIGDQREVANCEIAIAFAYDRLGQLSEARKQFVTALNKSQSLGDRRLVLVSLEALTTIDTSLGYWTPAQESLDKARQLAVDMKAEPMETTLLGDEAALEAAQGKFVKARPKLDEALRRAREGKDPVAIGTELYLLAELGLAQNDLQLAGLSLQEECSVWEKIGHALALSKCRVTSAEVAFREKDSSRAASLLSAAKVDTSAVDPGAAALDLQARLALDRKDIARAKYASGAAQSLLKTTPEQISLILDNQIVQAEIDAASGHASSARTKVAHVLQEARAHQLAAQANEAQIAMLRILASARP